VENNILNVNSDLSHVFVSHDSFFSGPLESIFHRVFNFIHELNSFSGVNEHVGSLIFGSERPDFKGIRFFPTVCFNKFLSSFFGIIFFSDGSGFDFVSDSFIEGFGSAVKSVMFVGRFGHANLAGFFSDGFFESDNGFSLNDFDVGEFGL